MKNFVVYNKKEQLHFLGIFFLRLKYLLFSQWVVYLLSVIGFKFQFIRVLLFAVQLLPQNAGVKIIKQNIWVDVKLVKKNHKKKNLRPWKWFKKIIVTAGAKFRNAIYNTYAVA